MIDDENENPEPESAPETEPAPSAGGLTGVPAGAFTDLSTLSVKDLTLALAKMNAGQKQLQAMKGNAAVRKILMRDPNIDVQLAIVSSPKSAENEVELMASVASSAEVVLKSIFSNARWARSYRIKHALAKNPKTPVAIANRCLRGLTPHDLKKIAQDPNVRKAVAMSAQQMVTSRR